MKMIQGSGKNLGIIPVLLKGNFHVSEYFIESSFKDAIGFFVTVGIVIPILSMLMSGEIMGVILWSFFLAVLYFIVFGK